MRSPLMDELSRLDPARGLRAPGSPHDPELAAVLAADRRAPAAYRPVRRPAHPAAIAGTVAGGVAAVAVGVTLTTTLGAPTAYATWTAVPVAVDAADAVERAGACPTAAHDIAGDGAEAEITEVPLEPVLAEARGDYTYVVLAGDGAVGDCFVTSGGEAPDVYSSDAVGVEVAVPDARGLTVAGSGTASWSAGDAAEGAVTSVFGRVGDEVAAVTVARTDGELVEATVEDGWFALWAPGESAFATSAQVTYTDGTVADAPLG
ncbi:hypothetical protein GCM10023216_24580 [Isoptericola chiayiensis]|uniref:Uncharacterized protein n=1 Tax=Isoptericola chiayiensis TaxID=579446 RepID=A0ABP8YL18_9MICO|nr:hypothetical protein [Isoptericola chiayiensis]NOW02356.1 hypothetical protein [Isoptericola chiayiensis]